MCWLAVWTTIDVVLKHVALSYTLRNAVGWTLGIFTSTTQVIVAELLWLYNSGVLCILTGPFPRPYMLKVQRLKKLLAFSNDIEDIQKTVLV